MLEQLRHSFRDRGVEHGEIDRQVGILVRQPRENGSDGDGDAELFTAFADKSLIERFARLALAADEFP